MLENNTQISLFPLNVVLFPGMMLPLHIFEERYKVMIRECLTDNRSFGVVLAKSKRAQAPNVATLERDDIYSVGTTAHITAIENLEDGRLNLITIGQDRFIIRNIHSSAEDFLVGQVDPFLMQGDDDPEMVEIMAQKLRPLVKQYIEHLGDASGEDLSEAVLPADPTGLAFLAGAAMQGPLPDKQRLLSANTLTTLIAKTTSVLDKEDKILEYMLRAYQAHQQIERLPVVDFSLN
jgi:Lon protease-like protein